MKIAYVIIDANQREGTARAVVEVAERLAVRHSVELFSRTAEDVDLARICWHRVPGLRRPEVANFATFFPLCSWMLRERGRRLVHSAGCNVIGANVFTIQNIQPAKVEVFRRLGSESSVSPLRRVSRWLHLTITSQAEKLLYTHRPRSRNPLFLPVSRGVEGELRKHYDIGPALVRVIPNAADTARFRPLEPDERATWRRANGIPEECIMMIFAGGEWMRKGLDLALKAMAMIKVVKPVLFVAGDDPNRGRFDFLASNLGIRQQVIFGGFRRDLPAALGAADLFLFPSWYEAFSLATIEAAACGLPVVATRINGTEDFILPGETGAFVDHDPEHIANVLNGLVCDLQKLKCLGHSARKLVEECYTWDIVAKKTEEAYREYIERS